MTALLLVDLQNDFMPGGALAVPAGDQVVPVANRLASEHDLVVASQDWHPANHGSFASRHAERSPGDVIELDGLEQTLWPDHCVQGTPGAELHEGLNRNEIAYIVFKGEDPAVDSYSAFFDNARRRATGLEQYLRERGATELVLMGLATDYCVKFSALDARSLGFDTTVALEGCRGIDLSPGDIQRSLDEMKAAGVRLV